MDTNTLDTHIGHYYEPIPYYNGAILKYRGIATNRNKEWMMAKPGMRMLPSYLGDRIDADTRKEFRGM